MPSIGRHHWSMASHRQPATPVHVHAFDIELTRVLHKIEAFCSISEKDVQRVAVRPQRQSRHRAPHGPAVPLGPKTDVHEPAMQCRDPHSVNGLDMDAHPEFSHRRLTFISYLYD